MCQSKVLGLHDSDLQTFYVDPGKSFSSLLNFHCDDYVSSIGQRSLIEESYFVADSRKVVFHIISLLTKSEKVVFLCQIHYGLRACRN